MAKRTAISVARSTVVTLIFLVGVLFAGHNFAFADVVSDAVGQGSNQSILTSVDDFLTGGANQTDTSSSTTATSTETGASTATSTAVGGSATSTDFEAGTSTSTLSSLGSTTDATSTGTTTPTGSASSTLPSLDGSTTTPNLGESATSTTSGLATSTNATSTATTTLTGTGTTTSTETSTSTASTTPPLLSGNEGNSTTTASTSLRMLAATSLVATTSDLTATSTATTTQSWRAKYYRYDDARNDMAGWGTPFDEIQGIDPGDPLATTWTKDWFTAGFLKHTIIEENIRFKDRFTPFANSTDPLSDPEAYIAAPNFGAHFMGIATVSEEKDYTVTITTDGDAWFYLDRVLQLKNLSGIKPAETLTKTIHMVPGQQYVLNMFFTERIALYPYFDFSFPGVTITPCNSDSCEPPALDPDTTGPSAPVITAPIPPISSTTTDITIPITWTTSVDPAISGAITSGLRGYIYVWDQIATTTPTLATGTLTTSTSTVITNLTPGIWWFHVIAIDNAGNTSAPPTHHGPFCIGLASCGTTPPVSGPFEIRDLRATDISQTSLVIRWRTVGLDGLDRSASSRVVYDLISQSATSTTPNYGYAYSTAVSDESPYVVEHAVTITGLSANTAYYFRGISVNATDMATSSEITATTLVTVVPPVTPSSGGGGGGGGGSGRHLVTSTTPAITTFLTTEVTAPVSCKPYLLQFIKFGANNDSNEVLKLQTFLKVFEGRDDIPLTGFYDLKTYQAVRDFQQKYGLDVLNPWGIADPTGYVFITTSLKINYLYCGFPDRITLNLRNIYPEGGARYATNYSGQTTGVITSNATSTLGILPVLLATANCTNTVFVIGTSTQNSVQLAFAGITGFLVHYPWIWILLLLLLIAGIIWMTRSTEKATGPEEKMEEKSAKEPEESANDSTNELWDDQYPP